LKLAHEQFGLRYNIVRPHNVLGIYQNIWDKYRNVIGIFIRNFNYRNNLICSANLINECIKNDTKIIFTSSMAVYGEQEPPFTEDKRPQPIDPYGVAKYAVECDLRLAHEQFGLRYNIVRPHNVLGVYQNIWDKYRNVIGIFIRKTLNGQPILVYGDGEQTRAFSDIKYYMEPFDKLLTDYDNEIFNIGADKYFTLNEVAETVQKIGKKYGYDVPIEHGEPRHEVKHAYCDHTKAKTVLDFKDETNLEELIESMFVWAMKQPNRKVKQMEYEVTKDIYEYWKDN
jgi:UDP-glucose 4-epimerase